MPADPRSPFDQWVRRIRDERRPIFARVVGTPYRVHEEPETDPARVDHIWFRVECPPVGRILIAVNTLSLLNGNAGHDPRVRLGIVRSTCARLPEPLLTKTIPLDYTTIEATTPVEFVTYEHDPLEQLLIRKGNAAVRVEAWGELYERGGLGLHQLHSRRASCAVPTDILGKDGGLKLYYRDLSAELLLFKFCGQP